MCDARTVLALAETTDTLPERIGQNALKCTDLKLVGIARIRYVVIFIKKDDFLAFFSCKMVKNCIK